jgi:CRISPR-associated protein Cmr5
MSRQRTLEQMRAAAAWECVREVKGRSYEKEYRALATSAPADIQSNGLGQTLAFWNAKGKPESGGDNAHAQLLKHTQAWLCRRLSLAENIKILQWITEDADTNGYRRATAEAMVFLGWVKRFAEAELKEPEPGGGES